MKTTNILLAFLLLCGSAKAATIVQTQNYAFTPSGNQTLTFNRFDTMGGTRILNSVTITTSLTKSGGSLYVDNDSAVPGSGTISQSVTVSLTSLDVDLSKEPFGALGANVTSTSNYFVDVGSDDGDGSEYQAGGPDWGGTTFADNTVSQTETVRDASETYFAGTGTYAIKVSGVQTTDTAAISGASGAFSPATALGFVTITYDYTSLTPVPEPGPWMMIGVGLSGALLFRRRTV